MSTDLVERLRHVNQRRCPFDDPKFRMDPLKPCPACGDVGDGPGVAEPSKCVSSNYLVLHTEAATALESLQSDIERLTAERDEALQHRAKAAAAHSRVA